MLVLSIRGPLTSTFRQLSEAVYAVQPTLALLLRREDLHLRLLDADEIPPEALAAPLTWAHSSDLPDPTPWLTEGGLLLTDGAQFTDGAGGLAEAGTIGDPPQAGGDRDTEPSAYVERLVAAGVAALGVSTVVHPAVPSAVVAACREHGLPLVEIAARTPFMAIIKAVTDAADQEQRDRLERSLEAQRAVARAALRPDGLTAVLRELEKRLDCWVALFDGSGHRVPIDIRIPAPAGALDDVRADVRRALQRGARGGSRIAGVGGDITLQTLGQPPRLRGVLVVGSTEPLDAAGHDLVTSVIAIASIALDQTRALDESRGLLRSGLLELMLAGSVDVAGRSAEQLWGPLPRGPIRVCAVVAGPSSGALTTDVLALASELELLAERRPGRVFFARRGDHLVTITRADDTSPVRKLLQHNGIPAGCSTPVAWSDLSTGLVEAQRASMRAHEGRTFVRFDDLVGDGILGLLEISGGATVARRLLQPLIDAPAEQRETLIETLRVWMEHNCAWDPAARELGIHRHTLRNRVTSVERLLGLDLDSFADRAELWAALELTS